MHILSLFAILWDERDFNIDHDQKSGKATRASARGVPLDPELFNDSKTRRGLHKNCRRRDCRGSEEAFQIYPDIQQVSEHNMDEKIYTLENDLQVSSAAHRFVMRLYWMFWNLFLKKDIPY